jgi:pyruvate/2-oxoglutarate/acetoin dehydrogenase E1 component
MREKKLSYLEAIGQAIREEMLRDKAVLLLGEAPELFEDMVSLNARLLEEFGPARVIETPMSEAAILGSAVGAALMGMRPVAEMQFLDFITCGFEQILNLTTQEYWRAGNAVPMVIRGPAGAVGSNPLGLDESEGWLLHTPNIKIVAPATVYDAKGMLKAAIRDNSPVLYLEQTMLYHLAVSREEFPLEDYVVPLGKAAVRRDGEDMTMLTYGAMVHLCLQAARMLEEDDDLAVEVLDLRTLAPLDHEAILESVRRTNKVLFVHEDSMAESVGNELTALITADLAEYLNGPVTRVSAPSVMPAYMLPDRAYTPHTAKILSAARSLAAY